MRTSVILPILLLTFSTACAPERVQPDGRPDFDDTDTTEGDAEETGDAGMGGVDPLPDMTTPETTESALCCFCSNMQCFEWAAGELACEQPADDPLPDLTDAGEAPTAIVDWQREAAWHNERAADIARTLHATEATVLDLRAACARTERELAETRAQLRQTEGAAGAHVATISALREQIAAAHRAAHAPARTLEERADIARRAWDESPPADPGPVEWDELPPAGQAAWCAVVRACDTSAAPAEQIPGVAATRLWIAEYDDPPATKPSERPAKETSR